MNAKIWKIVQRSNTKAENLWNDFNEIADAIREMGWGGGKKRQDFSSRKKKRVREGGQISLELLLMSSVFVVWYRAPMVESIFALVTEWIPSKALVKLYELSSTLCAVLQEWFHDQTWIDMSEEWDEIMYGTARHL